MEGIFPLFPMLYAENSSACGQLRLMQIRFKNAVLLDNSGTKSIVNKAETCCWQKSIQDISNSAVIKVAHWQFDKLTSLHVTSVWALVIVILVVQLQF